MKKINHVLLIDDSEADNFFHKLIISETQLVQKLDAEQDCRKALHCWEKGCATGNNERYPVPDLVFLDINMPAMNGFEVLDKLRTIPDPEHRLQKMKIFMLTTSVNPDDRERALQQYADLLAGFRIKPLTENMFIEIVQQYF
ncbi:MAG: response regulator [Chitinophagales bacterium]|nr:response regulator [Chitinophagales bacterium]